jgi:hypothetical protein
MIISGKFFNSGQILKCVSGMMLTSKAQASSDHLQRQYLLVSRAEEVEQHNCDARQQPDRKRQGEEELRRGKERCNEQDERYRCKLGS